MRYELTGQVKDDITMSHSIIGNMEDIQKLQNEIAFLKKQIVTLAERQDIVDLLIRNGKVTIESRL